MLSRNFNWAFSPPTDLAPARQETAAKMSFVEENKQKKKTRSKAQVVSMSDVDINVSLSCGWYAERARVRVQFVERG